MMLSKLLAGTEWSEFAGYMSPAFLEALPPAMLARQLRQIATNYLTRRGFTGVKATVLAAAKRYGLPVEDTSSDTDDRSRSLPPGQRGKTVLRLYFMLILALDVALLDLRAASFRDEGEGLIWSPAPLFVTWTPEFICNLRALYSGFYLGDDGAFRSALCALGLAGAEAELRAHFGADQGSLDFHLTDFRRSMNAVFSAAVRTEAKIAPEMLHLGIALACLYEHLETLGEAFDVRAAYLDAVAATKASP